MLALEIVELENHKKNMRINDELLSIRTQNMEKWQLAKSRFYQDLNHEILGIGGSMITGMIACRSIVYGGLFGALGYRIGLGIY